MSIERITYDNFQNDPFINELDINDETKGAYEILKWAYQTYENDGYPLFQGRADRYYCTCCC